jgi:hypothetical protein
MGDGRFTVPIATDDGRVLAWGRGDCEVPNASYHMRMGTQLRYLRLVDGAVTEISQEAKDALAAEDAARAEQQRLDDLAAAEAAASAPFRVSKRKLRQSMYELNRAAEFRAFLAADLKRQEYYDDSQYLESDHAMVIEAMPAFASLLPEGALVIDFLRSCEDR